MSCFRVVSPDPALATENAHNSCMLGRALITRECHSSGNPVVVQKKDTGSLVSRRDIAQCLWYIPARFPGVVEPLNARLLETVFHCANATEAS